MPEYHVGWQEARFVGKHNLIYIQQQLAVLL
jgi:hypothetical protein